MDLYKLKIFCEVYLKKNYSHAAGALKLTQSAVSQQVRALEKELGISLFEKENRTLSTAAADYLFKEGMKILAQIEDVKNGLLHVSGVGSGTVRFGMIDVAAIWLLPGVLKRFKKKHPHVKMEAVVKTSAELVELVERHELDFAIVVTNNVAESLNVKHIYQDSIVAVVPRGSPLNHKRLSVKELKGEPLIIYPMSSFSRMLVEDVFRKNGVVPTVNMEMHYPSAILSLVEQGMGVGLVSELSAKELRFGGASVVYINELKGARKIGIIAYKDRLLSPQAKALISMIEGVKFN